MNGLELVAKILKKEGVEWMAFFPANRLIEAVARESIRPVIFRTERSGIMAADGYSRMGNGRRFGIFGNQRGPGAENSFGGVAQAWGDAVPILILADADETSRLDVPPVFRASKNYQHITKWAETVLRPERIAPMFRRAFHELRTGRPGPVLLELPRDIMASEIPAEATAYSPPRGGKFLPSPSDVKDAVRALLAARAPVILAGQGVLYADASNELTELAELAQVPVMTTMPGKSAIDERHPLSLGATNLTTTGPVWQWMQQSDVFFGIGTSMTRTVFGIDVPDGKRMIQSTISPSDIAKDYDIDIELIGDARLVLAAMIDEVKAELGPQGRRADASVREAVAGARRKWMDEWRPLLASDETPINPYRVVWDLRNTLDLENSIVTHDAGHPRDQMMPFFPATAPHSYIGWGKTTHLGYGIGLMIGAKMAHPEKFCLNFMGDAAFGQAGLDIETSVRAGIPITTVIVNNGGMGGYPRGMPTAFAKYGASALSGDYAAVARGLGAEAVKVDEPAGIVPAVNEARKLNAEGKTCVIEIVTREENRMSSFGERVH